MPSRAGKMEKQIAKAGLPEQKTKVVGVRIDVTLDGVERSVLIEIGGVPVDLPTEYEKTVISTAEKQFGSALNSFMYITTFEKGKTSKEDNKPVFYNLSKVSEVVITNLEKAYEIEDK